MTLEDSIRRECSKLICRHHARVAGHHEIQQRFEKATGQKVPHQRPKTPKHWQLARWFDPFKVRKSAPRIAQSIGQNLARDRYDPMPALIVEMPKPEGGTRQISVYPVADAAVANHYYRQLRDRNQSRLSPFSYAYRSDLSIHDVIERLWREFGVQSHFFAVEYDFSKYFDTIDHRYVVESLNRHFRITRKERLIIDGLLSSRRAFGLDRYRAEQFRRCTRGIPQGNSLSLFLANVACHELDLEMTRHGLLFARYADDIVVLCRSLTTAGQARELIMHHCDRTGLAVNFDKSPGITELGPQGLRPDATAHSDLMFLGHGLGHRTVRRRGTPAKETVRRLSIRPRTARRLKGRLATIVHSHLLRYPEQGLWKKSRVDLRNGVDWDLVTCINDLRKYVYGGLPEDEIRTALGDRGHPLHKAQGYMAFFPLVTDVEQLRQMDGWLANAVLQALRRRERELKSRFGLKRYPHLDLEDLISGDWYPAALSNGVEIANDVRLPSFVRAWKYARRGLSIFGLRQYPERLRELEELYR